MPDERSGSGVQWDGKTAETDFGRLILERIGGQIIADTERLGRLGRSIGAIGQRLPGDAEAGRAARLLGAGIELTAAIAALRIILSNAEDAQNLIREQAANAFPHKESAT